MLHGRKVVNADPTDAWDGKCFEEATSKIDPFIKLAIHGGQGEMIYSKYELLKAYWAAGCNASEAAPIPPELGGDPEARWQLGKLVGNLHRSIEQGVGTSFDPDWTELQYAYYPLGGFYHKHIDSGAFHTHPLLADSPDGSRRLIKRACSFVLYLNDQWTEADGGHLRVYDSAAPDAAYRDVAPTAGTLVVFKSDEVLHEVMRSNARRVSIVGCAWPRTHGPNHSFSPRAPRPLLTALPLPPPLRPRWFNRVIRAKDASSENDW